MRSGPEGTVPGCCHRDGHACRDGKRKCTGHVGGLLLPLSWTEFMAVPWPWAQANACAPGMYLEEAS